MLGLAGVLLAGAASAQDTRSVPRILLDRRLVERLVQLTGVDDRTVMYLDAAGQPRTDLLTEYLAILPPSDASILPSAERPVGIVELVDGQRMVGSLDPVRTPPADSFAWIHPGLGPLVFKLEDTRRIQLQGGAEPPSVRPDDSTDLVMMINGDLIDGFVDAVSSQISVSVGQSTRELPADRVQNLVLSGSKPRPPAPGMIAWIRDGSVLASRAIQTSRDGEVVITPSLAASEGAASEASSSHTLSMRLEDLRAISLDAAAIMPLASLKIESQAPGPGRRWSRPVQVIEPRWSALGLADIELPGPMAVEWALPATAGRFAADLELPRQMWTWGDCEVVVSIVDSGGTSELWRRRINAEAPRARIIASIPAGARRLRIQLNAGEFGAVQDKVLIRRGIIAAESR